MVHFSLMRTKASISGSMINLLPFQALSLSKPNGITRMLQQRTPKEQKIQLPWFLLQWIEVWTQGIKKFNFRTQFKTSRIFSAARSTISSKSSRKNKKFFINGSKTSRIIKSKFQNFNLRNSREIQRIQDLGEKIGSFKWEFLSLRKNLILKRNPWDKETTHKQNSFLKRNSDCFYFRRKAEFKNKNRASNNTQSRKL